MGSVSEVSFPSPSSLPHSLSRLCGLGYNCACAVHTGAAATTTSSATAAQTQIYPRLRGGGGGGGRGHLYLEGEHDWEARPLLPSLSSCEKMRRRRRRRGACSPFERCSSSRRRRRPTSSLRIPIARSCREKGILLARSDNSDGRAVSSLLDSETQFAHLSSTAERRSSAFAHSVIWLRRSLNRTKPRFESSWRQETSSCILKVELFWFHAYMHNN